MSQLEPIDRPHEPGDPANSPGVLRYAEPAAARRFNVPALIGFCFALVALPVSLGFARQRSPTVGGILASIGLILGILALRAPAALPGEGRPRRALPLLVVLLAVAALACTLSLRQEGRIHDVADPCMYHLRDIGMACDMYANSHNGHYPDMLSDLLNDGNITPDTLVCPMTNDSPATGPTTQAIEASIQSGGHLSYIYVGKGTPQ